MGRFQHDVLQMVPPGIQVYFYGENRLRLVHGDVRVDWLLTRNVLRAGLPVVKRLLEPLIAQVRQA